MEPEVIILYGIPPVDLKELQKFGFTIPPCIPDFMEEYDLEDKIVFTGFQTLGAITVASYLKNNGIKVKVQDFYADAVDVSAAKIVGISSTFMYMDDVKRIAKYVKNKNLTAFLILGGPLSWSYDAKKIFSEIPEIELIILQEGEKNFLTLVQKILQNEPFDNVLGIVYKRGNKIAINPNSSFIKGEEIPEPDWNMINLDKRIKILPVETTRGCTYQCTFCSETAYWPKPIRIKPIQKLIDEIKTNIRQFNVNTFRFVDSCFTSPKKRCAAICEAIIEEGICINWTSYARIDNMKIDLLEKMKESGCVAVDIGMESGDSEILEKMEKNYTPNDIIDAVQAAKELDILTHCNLVIGFPGETSKTIDNTIDVLEKAQSDTYDAYLLDVAPNTSIFKNPEQYGIQGMRCMWKHETMDTKQAIMEIQRLYKNVNKSHPFMGGEYFAGVLTSFGYSLKQIRNFFATFHDVYKNPKAKTPKEFEVISKNIKNFIVPWNEK